MFNRCNNLFVNDGHKKIRIRIQLVFNPFQIYSNMIDIKIKIAFYHENINYNQSCCFMKDVDKEWVWQLHCCC